MSKKSSRFENKYLLSEAQHKLILDQVSLLAQIDPRASQGGYWVNSLYYDTADLQDFYDSLEGICCRRKIRYRSYNSEKQEFFEEKVKCNQSIAKFRCPKEQISRYSKLVYLYNRHPVVRVKYKREAFEVPGYQLRLTFDSLLSVQSQIPPADWWQALLPRAVIFESKHNGIIPEWLSRIIQDYQLSRLSLSKYCMAIQTCGIV